MKRLGSFLSGAAAALAVVALGTSVLAATGNLTFNPSHIVVDGETAFSAGDDMTAENGQQVPVSIYYTDAAGGGTHYLSLRAICELLGVEVSYDADTQTVYVGEGEITTSAFGKRWLKTVDSDSLLYFCEEEGHTYDAPLTYRLTWEEEGWGINDISYDPRYYTTDWRYQGPDGKLTLSCGNPSTAGFGRQIDQEGTIENCQAVTVQGYDADYYQDGDHTLLIWENDDGILFFLSGQDVSRDTMMRAAESVALAPADTVRYTPEWLPSGFSLLERYEIGDTAQTYWVEDGYGLAFTCSGGELAVQDWESETVEINGAVGYFWAAQEEPIDNGTSGSSASAVLPGVGSTTTNMLAWQDPDTGMYFRLQGRPDQDTLIRIAESIR